MSTSFPALVLKEDGKAPEISIETLNDDDLPDGDVTVRIAYSTLNYKDGMVIKGIGRLVRNYPHVPGIDFAGEVESSDSDRFKPGDQVILTGYGLGERHWGGFAGKMRVNAKWLVPMPNDWTAKEAMTMGTAGFTAMLSVMALEDHGLKTGSGEVLVTGASGGVGSVAVSVLSRLGYKVAAVTGRPENADYLKGLGAQIIVPREEIEQEPQGPLGTAHWAGAIDNVGGPSLHTVLATTNPGGSVASVGVAGSNELHTTVLPFVLRGVNLLGIDSNYCPMERRKKAWARLADVVDASVFEALSETIGLEDVPDYADRILKGQVRGRVIVDPTA